MVFFICGLCRGKGRIMIEVEIPGLRPLLSEPSPVPNQLVTRYVTCPQCGGSGTGTERGRSPEPEVPPEGPYSGCFTIVGGYNGASVQLEAGICSGNFQFSEGDRSIVEVELRKSVIMYNVDISVDREGRVQYRNLTSKDCSNSTRSDFYNFKYIVRRVIDKSLRERHVIGKTEGSGVIKTLGRIVGLIGAMILIAFTVWQLLGYPV